MKPKTPLTSSWKVVRRISRTTGGLLKLCLRKLKLQILPQLTKWNGDTEEAKVAIYKHRGKALFLALPHLIPFGAVMTLMVFNINTFFIGNFSASAVTAFQFAAKLFELLMQASLATILLDVIRRQIVKNQDLPLGGLLAPLRTTDISYLWSLELWGALTSKYLKAYRKLYLGALIFAIVTLSALVGPSGAVALIPRPINYFSGQYLNILNPLSNLFPDTIEYLDNGTVFDEGLLQIGEFFGGDGPYPVADEDGIRMFGTPSDTGLPFSAATIPSRHMSYILRSQGANLNGSGEYSSTGLKMQTSQALVTAACSENDLLDLDHNNSYLNFPESGNQLNSLITWGDALQNATEDNNILFFANLPPSSPTRYSTLLIIGTTAPVDREFVATVSACVVDATWTNVVLNSTGADSWSQINYVLSTHYTSVGIPPSEKIIMPPAWTDRVRSTILASETALDFLGNYTSPEKLLAFVLSNSDYDYLQYYGLVLSPYPDCCSTEQQSTALSGYLNQTHAWSTYSAVSIDTNTAWTDPTTLTHQVIRQFQTGYGYNTADITVQLSLAVLGLYLLFVTAHVLFLLLTGYTGTSWDSIGELLVLGLMSRTPRFLGKVSVGVETLGTYREPVGVRVNERGSVDLVFGNDPDTVAAAKAGRWKALEVNKEY